MVPCSLKSVYDTYNWNANQGGQTGWNFSTLMNRPISFPKNQSYGELIPMEVYEATGLPTANATITAAPNIPWAKAVVVPETFNNFNSASETTIPAVRDLFAPIASNRSTMPQQNSINNKATLPKYSKLKPLTTDSQTINRSSNSDLLMSFMEPLTRFFFIKNSSSTFTSTSIIALPIPNIFLFIFSFVQANFIDYTFFA